MSDKLYNMGLKNGAAAGKKTAQDFKDSMAKGGGATALASKAAPKASGGGGLDKYRGFDPESDSGRNYAAGTWGTGSMNAEALATKFGLDRSQEGRGEGHIWGKNADGSEVYIGKADMSLASNKELISAHSAQANTAEVDHSSVPDNLSSSGDIRGAILNLWDGGDGAAPAPEEGTKEPTKLSNVANKALAYTEAYNDFTTQGYSDDNPISGSVELKSGNLGARQQFLDNYKLNLQRRLEPGTADKYGGDDLGPSFDGADSLGPDAITPPAERKSKIAADIVNKGAGFYTPV
mgnify:CR=1 FL=1